MESAEVAGNHTRIYCWRCGSKLPSHNYRMSQKSCPTIATLNKRTSLTFVDSEQKIHVFFFVFFSSSVDKSERVWIRDGPDIQSFFYIRYPASDQVGRISKLGSQPNSRAGYPAKLITGSSLIKMLFEW